MFAENGFLIARMNWKSRILSLWQDKAIRTSLILFCGAATLFNGLGSCGACHQPRCQVAQMKRYGRISISPFSTTAFQGCCLAPGNDSTACDTPASLRKGTPLKKIPFSHHFTRLASMYWVVCLAAATSPTLTAAILISNLACLGLFILVYRITAETLDESVSARAIVYLALFPVGFFLMAPYTESLFILLAIGSIWAARRDKFVVAGVLGLLASLTRLTGWVLIVPLAYEFWDRYLGYGSWKIEPSSWYRRNIIAGLMVFMPPLGLVLFMAYRWLIGLPSLPTIYAEYWYQTTGFPGVDLLTALNSMFLGGSARAGEFTLWFDFFVTLLLIGTTIHAIFRFNRRSWGLYSAMLLLFILLPTSEVKPLYSFSRYTLAFIPTFMLLAEYGRNPIIHRIILYSSLVLYLYFSGQFVAWGWVA